MLKRAKKKYIGSLISDAHGTAQATLEGPIQDLCVRGEAPDWSICSQVIWEQPTCNVTMVMVAAAASIPSSVTFTAEQQSEKQHLMAFQIGREITDFQLTMGET